VLIRWAGVHLPVFLRTPHAKGTNLPTSLRRGVVTKAVFQLLLLLQLSQPAPAQTVPKTSTVISGVGSPTVTIPRIEAMVQIDGRLDEPVWSRAARLGGFSQYQPIDGRSAEEQTEVLVWYSPAALHVGIIAYDREPSSIRATLADRDNLDSEDSVTIYLDTFNDHRRAFFFTVNPLGIQQDGVLSEAGFNAGSLKQDGGALRQAGGATDKNPDYQFDSKGRITKDGYVVELRIPFKSLRYSGNGPQRWGLNILRTVQRTGYLDTWTDARRAGESFLAQAGGIDGLHDMQRGVVTEVQPFITTAVNGSRGDVASPLVRERPDINPGVNLRFSTTNLTVDSTVNPDFSQVESDASQVTVNERFALFFPEKRPFFLEGIELFAAPNQLVYSRQIVNPLAGGKVTGKIGGLNIAYLAVKEKEDSGGALFNVARLRYDVGPNSTVGVTLTDRTAGGTYNRVVSADSRVIFKRVYYVQAQAGGSWTDDGTGRRASPLWMLEWDRTGRAFGFNYKVTGTGPGFKAAAGYVPRNDIVEAHVSNRYSWYGARGSWLETVSPRLNLTRIWRYSSFDRGPLEGTDQASVQSQWRGGWNVNVTVKHLSWRFEPEAFNAYQVSGAGGSVAYKPIDRVTGTTSSMTLKTPIFRTFNAQLDAQRGPVAIFAEGAGGRETRLSATLSARPTGSIRMEATATYSSITRERDGSEFAQTVIPRFKVEYQVTRSVFFRMVAEYQSQRQAVLIDAIDGVPLIVSGPFPAAYSTTGLRLDWLASYKPTPGTVAFFGYGSSLAYDRLNPLSNHLERMSDGFFLKIAYQFRR
jgi:hypothetical protein